MDTNNKGMEILNITTIIGIAVDLFSGKVEFGIIRFIKIVVVTFIALNEVVNGKQVSELNMICKPVRIWSLVSILLYVLI